MDQRVLLIENLQNAMNGRIDQLAAQLTEQLRNQNLTEAAHQQVHREVAELRGMAADVETLKTASPIRADKNPTRTYRPVRMR